MKLVTTLKMSWWEKNGVQRSAADDEKRSAADDEKRSAADDEQRSAADDEKRSAADDEKRRKAYKEHRRERKKITARIRREKERAEILRLQQLNRPPRVENVPSDDLVKSALIELFQDEETKRKEKDKVLPPKGVQPLGSDMEIDCRDHKALIGAFVSSIRRVRNMASAKHSRDRKKAKLDFLRGKTFNTSP
jgi:hypothetical protein